MERTVFLEPLAEDQNATDQVYEGVSLDHLRKVVLEVPGVQKIYPRAPYLVQALRASYSQVAGLLSDASQADRGSSPGQEQVPTLTVRLGVDPGFRTPEVARKVGKVLAAELPGKPVSVEVVSC